MHIKTTLSVFISFLSALTASAVLRAASLEEKYFETRDRFIAQFWGVPNPADDGSALVELERQIRTIIGSVQIEGVPSQGGINLQTLHNELGFGSLDGLRFDSDRETVVVTTVKLLDHYLIDHQLPNALSELSKTGDFYALVFSGDAAVTHYVELPVKVARSESFAYAFLGLVAQDVGPYLPTTVFVFVKTGSRIIIASSPSQKEIQQIDTCKNEWTSFDTRATEAYALYKASKLNDHNAFDNYVRYQDEGFSAYVVCFGREAKSQRFFPSVMRQAQSMVDRLQKDPVE